MTKSPFFCSGCQTIGEIDEEETETGEEEESIEASKEHLRDKTKPHFSLAKMQAIPPHKDNEAKRVLYDLMDKVENKVRHFRRECWAITIEVLADHLGLMTNPWKYSLPGETWKGPIDKPNYPGFQQLKEYIQSTGLVEEYIEAAKKELAEE